MMEHMIGYSGPGRSIDVPAREEGCDEPTTRREPDFTAHRQVSVLKTAPTVGSVDRQGRYTTVVAVVGTFVLITIVVMLSDVVAAPGVASDVVRVTGAQLVAWVSSAWQKRYESRRPAQACTACGGTVSG